MGLVKVAKRSDITFDYNNGYAEVEVVMGEAEQAIFMRWHILFQRDAHLLGWTVIHVQLLIPREKYLKNMMTVCL